MAAMMADDREAKKLKLPSLPQVKSLRKSKPLRQRPFLSQTMPIRGHTKSQALPALPITQNFPFMFEQSVLEALSPPPEQYIPPAAQSLASVAADVKEPEVASNIDVLGGAERDAQPEEEGMTL